MWFFFFFNLNNNFISLILKTTVFVSTIYLILLVKSTTLTLSLYLILTPYLTSSAQNLISFFELFTEFGKIENILNEFENLKFLETSSSRHSHEISGYNLYLYHIFYKDENISLKDINLDFEFGKVIFINSDNISELQTLHKIILRNKILTAGTLFLDSKNVFEIPIEDYKKIVTTTNSTPFFYSVSIIENLMMVINNKKLILKSLKSFQLLDKINLLKNKENTVIDDSFDNNLLFMLGLIRCFLSGSKIICIESLPSLLSEEYKNLFFEILKILKNKCTVIIFSNHNIFNLPYDKFFKFYKSSIKEIRK